VMLSAVVLVRVGGIAVALRVAGIVRELDVLGDLEGSDDPSRTNNDRIQNANSPL
jgi:hypothetical protein